jgi:hypothetical protein
VPPRPAETAELQIALDHLRNYLAAAPAGAAAAAAAREESQRADAERRRATGEAELPVQLLAQLNALPSSPASLAAFPAHPAFPDAARLRDVTYIGSAGGGGGGGSDGAAARAHAAASRSELAERAAQRFQDTPMGFEDPLTGELNPDKNIVIKEQTLWEARLRKTTAQRFDHFDVKNCNLKALEDAQSRALLLALVRSVGRRIVRAAGAGPSRTAADLLEAANVLGAMEQPLYGWSRFGHLPS